MYIIKTRLSNDSEPHIAQLKITALCIIVTAHIDYWVKYIHCEGSCYGVLFTGIRFIAFLIYKGTQPVYLCLLYIGLSHFQNVVSVLF